MKAWISIALVLGLVVAIVLGGMIWRDRQDARVALQLEGEEARLGLEIARNQGCIACHSLDGSPGIGPTWLGVHGSERQLADGSSVIADEDYLRESIVEPGAKLVAGYQNLMLRYPLPPDDMAALLELLRQLEGQSP